MGRTRKFDNIQEIIDTYKDCRSIKKTASLCHTSTTRVIRVLDENGVKKQNVGKKFELDAKEKKKLIREYSMNKKTMSEISSENDISLYNLRGIFEENDIVGNRWNGHVKLAKNKTMLAFIRQIKDFLDKNEVNYKSSCKVGGCKVDILIGDKIAINLYRLNSIKECKHLLLNHKSTCKKNNVNLIEIMEDEFYLNPDVVFSKLRRILGLDGKCERIYARKCDVREIETNMANEFLDDNHIQGGVSSTIYLGAFYCGELVGVMSFLTEGHGLWNLNRFATDNKYICCGLGSKMFNYFIKTYCPISVRSFADYRWTLDGKNNLYTKLGFELEYLLRPGYTYFNQNINKHLRLRRERFKKSNLNKKYGFPMTMTELEMTKELGYDRIWDCGLFKYVWRKENRNS